MAEKICIKYTLTGPLGITLKTVASLSVSLLLKECEEFLFLHQGMVFSMLRNGWKTPGLYGALPTQPGPISSRYFQCSALIQVFHLGAGCKIPAFTSFVSLPKPKLPELLLLVALQ